MPVIRPNTAGITRFAVSQIQHNNIATRVIEMIMRLLPNSFKLYWKQLLVSFLVVLYVAINVFRVGGDTFVFNLNNNVINPLAIGVSVLAFIISSQTGGKGQNRLLWWGLTIGWALWTVAQLWWSIAGIIGQEVPYPSWADFFWLVGYLPMYFALWERNRSLPVKINIYQNAGIWISGLLTVAWTTVFVLIPIFQNNDPTAVLESVLNILYPLADLILMVLVLRIFFAYQQGLSGRVWAWLSAGFIFTSLSDLIFSYASTADLYYPDGKANLISTIGVDVIYNLGYLFWVFGLLIARSIQQTHQTFSAPQSSFTSIPNTHLLVFIKADDTVIDVSQNYSRIFPVEGVQGKTIMDVLGISQAEADGILEQVKAKSILKEKAFSVRTNYGPQQALISAEFVAGARGDYSGAVLLLRMTQEDYFLDKLLTSYQKGMVLLLSRKTGVKEKEDDEIKQLLSNYHAAYLNAYYLNAFSEGGSILADSFISELGSVARLHGWEVGIRPDALLDVSSLSLSKTREALPVLSESARQFIINISDEPSANKIARNVHSLFDAAALKSILHFEKADGEHTGDLESAVT